VEKPGIHRGGNVEEIMVNKQLSTGFVENAVDGWWNGVHTLWRRFESMISGGNPVENYAPVIHVGIAQ
jgi:hypothetical protein